MIPSSSCGPIWPGPQEVQSRGIQVALLPETQAALFHALASQFQLQIQICLHCWSSGSHLELSSAFRHENPSWTIPEPCQKITLANCNEIKRASVPSSKPMLSLQQLSGKKQSRVALKERTESIVCSLRKWKENSHLYFCLPTDVFPLEDVLPAYGWVRHQRAGSSQQTHLNHLILPSLGRILNPNAISYRYTLILHCSSHRKGHVPRPQY